MSELKVRRMKVLVHDCESKTGWNNSSITFTEYSLQGPRKEVIVTIEDPWQMASVQEQLEKITAYWADRVKAVRP